jgi:hypothetical protein
MVASFSFNRMATSFFGDPSQMYLFVIGALLLAVAPLGFLFLLGIKLLGSKLQVKWPALGLTVAFLIGLTITIIASSRITREFSSGDGVQTEVAISPTVADTFNVMISNPEKHSRKHGWGHKFMPVDDDRLMIKDVSFDIQESPDDSIYIQVLRNSRGSNVKACKVRAKAIEYEFEVVDNQITFDPHFIINKEDGWRIQDVSILMLIPEGKSVYLGKNTDAILNDVQNTTNTYDRNMPENTWRMEAEGLTCTSCGI